MKICALSLYQPLHHLFSLSLSQKYLPLEWRTHLIKPIFKSGDKSSIRNYRPISLLSVASKVLEKLIFNSIVDFVSDSISVSPFGFLLGRSTLQQMLVFFNTLLSSASQTDVIYLDFKKAFDSVAHNELLCKLWKFGITGDLWQWVRAYLSNRVQCVSIGQSTSPMLPVISGVPQGSILGPVLFLIFVNDLPSTLSLSKVLLFADDTKCIMPICSLQDCLNLQTDLSRLSDWCSTWNLPLNEEKCSSIHFKPRSSPSSFTYHLNGKQISSIAAHKDLGLFVSADITWRSHYKLISSRAYKMLGILRSFLQLCVGASLTVFVHFSCSFPAFLLFFCALKYLECVQRRATKFIASNPHLDYRNRLIHLNLLPLMEFEIVDIMFLVKSVVSIWPFQYTGVCPVL